MNTPAIVKPSTKINFSHDNIVGEYSTEYFGASLADFSIDVFNVDYWQAKQALTGTAQGRGTTYFIQANEAHHWVLRHYYRGGLIGKFNRDSYIFTGVENTRAAQEFNLLHQMYTKGLPVPKPVAYRVIKRGLFYSADLLSQRIENAQDLVGLLTKKSVTTALCYKIGKVIRAFHDNGIYHHDLNIHNILIDQQEKVWIIDFDRGEIRTNNASWKQSNLDRLARSFAKEKQKLEVFFWEQENWQQLIKGYQLEQSEG